MENIESYLIQIINKIVEKYQVRVSLKFNDRDSVYIIFVDRKNVPLRLENALELKLALSRIRIQIRKDFPESAVYLTTTKPYTGTGGVIYSSHNS